MGNTAGRIIGNIAIIGAKFAYTLVSIAGAVASGGVTAPFAVLSYLSTAASVYDFIKDPSGNVNRSIINTFEWVAKTIGPANGDQVISAINHAEALTNPFGSVMSNLNVDTIINHPRLIETASSIAESHITALNRATGNNTASAASISSIISPGVRSLNMAQGNRMDRLRSRTFKVSANAGSISSRVTSGV